MAERGVSALVLAAGCGERLGLGPKGFLELAGRPLLCWLADKLQTIADEVLVAVPAGSVQAATALLPGCRVMAGGDTRQGSIAKLAAQARGEWLLVHDGARPFASPALFRAVLAAAQAHGCAAAFLSPLVPVARLSAGRVVEAYAGDEVGIFQTPNAYSRTNMHRVLEYQRQCQLAPDWSVPSAVQLALAAGIAVHAVVGERNNFKVTTIDDWRAAQHLEHLLA